MQYKVSNIRWDYLYFSGLFAIIITIGVLQFNRPQSATTQARAISASLTTTGANSVSISGTVIIPTSVCPNMKIVVGQLNHGVDLETTPSDLPSVAANGSFTVSVPANQPVEVAAVSETSSDTSDTPELPLCAAALYTPSAPHALTLTANSTAVALFFTAGNIAYTPAGAGDLANTPAFEMFEQYLASQLSSKTISEIFSGSIAPTLLNAAWQQFEQPLSPSA